eukprot:16225010-Heterocapsa_arctica.AAC.1
MNRAMRVWCSVSKALSIADRNAYLIGKASEAQMAAHNNDMRTSFGVVRALSGYTVSHDKSVYLSDGLRTFSEQQRQQRWHEHFSSLL